VPAGTGIFTILGFSGLYLFMSLLFVVLILRIVHQGPDEEAGEPEPSGPEPEPAGAS
jgi:cytochrome bd-type quinol oxidase subunit 1